MKFVYKKENNSITIMKFVDKGLIDIEIPREIDELPVAKIGESAFQYCDEIISIVIPNTVTEIDKWAFSDCKNLTHISIPNSVLKIGRNAFSYCKNLEKIVIPEDVKVINSSTFSGCSNLKDVHISDKVVKIDWYAFVDCISLIEIHIPDSIEEIGGAAFKGCIRLENIHIPKRVKELGWHAFEGCTHLSAINVGEENDYFASMEGVLYDKSKTTLLCYPIHMDESFSIPEGVIKIREDAFWGCQNLKSVFIPQSVVKIGNHAFHGCRLISIAISNAIKEIGEWAFGDLSRISRIRIIGDRNGKVDGLKELKKAIYNRELHYFSGNNYAYEYLFNPKQKQRLALTYAKGEVNYEEDQRVIYDHYIANHLKEIVFDLIDEDSVEGLSYIQKANKLDGDHIDEFIEEANQKKAINSLAYLMDYKNKNIGLGDISDLLSLDD